MNAVKAAIIDGTKDPDLRKALGSFPGRYFQVAAETCDDPEDRISVLWRFVELYSAHVDQMERLNDARDAEQAAQRRAHLRVVTEDGRRSHGVQELSPHCSTEGAAP
jgi:hypothetical protein